MKNSNHLAYWAAGLSCVAVFTHAFNIQEHLHEWWGYGAFFILAASVQLYYGIILFVRPWRYDESGALAPGREARGRTYYRLGIVLNTVVILFYVVTRITGLPFLSAQAVAEGITPVNLLSVIVNVPIIYCLYMLLRQASADPSGVEQVKAASMAPRTDLDVSEK